MTAKRKSLRRSFRKSSKSLKQRRSENTGGWGPVGICSRVEKNIRKGQGQYETFEKIENSTFDIAGRKLCEIDKNKFDEIVAESNNDKFDEIAAESNNDSFIGANPMGQVRPTNDEVSNRKRTPELFQNFEWVNKNLLSKGRGSGRGSGRGGRSRRRRGNGGRGHT